MSRPLSERELKRVGRALAGHFRDKDRERWKRKVSGQAKPAGADKPLRAIRDEAMGEAALEDIEAAEE